MMPLTNNLNCIGQCSCILIAYNQDFQLATNMLSLPYWLCLNKGHEHYQVIYYDMIEGDKIFMERDVVTIIWAIKT